MIRFGIAGFGLHAVRRLMPGFALAKKCQVVALSRRDSQKAAEASREYKIPLVFASTEEMCRSAEVDAVLVTTPDVRHKDDVLCAVGARKHVLCEKPMAMNADECHQMVEAAHKAGVLLGVAQVFRFEESTARLRAHIAAGEIGRPILARAEFCYPGRQHARTWLYQKAIAAGGPIADVGVHCIDILRYILQDEIMSVSAIAASDDKSGDVESAGVLSLRFRRGTLATVLVSTRAYYRTALEFVGDAAVLRADHGLLVDRPLDIELLRDQDKVRTETVSNELAYALQVDAFADAIEGREPFPVPGEEGWQNQIVLDAAYRSIASGRVENVELIAGRSRD